MDEQQLAELEMHLAAGTDIPTAFAAVQRDQPRRRSPINRWAVLFGVILALLWMLWK